LAMNSRKWRGNPICPGPRGATDCTDVSYEVQIPSTRRQPGAQAGYSPGAMLIRYQMWNPVGDTVCAGPWKNGDISTTQTTLQLSFTTPDGAEHRVIDTGTHAAMYAVGCGNDSAPVPANRGTEFVSTDGFGAR